MMTATCLTIAGSDSGGGAGIQADLKTFSALGVFGTSVITAVTAQNTQAVTAIFAIPPNIIRAQIEAVLSDITVHAVKIGMLGTREVVVAVAEALEGYPGLVVLDPVMVAKSGDALLQDEAVSALRDHLLPRADLVTPNLPEAAKLLGCAQSRGEAEATAQGHALRAQGARAVLMKGGHAKGPLCHDILVAAAAPRCSPHARIDTRNTHGTGCTLSSAIAAELARAGPWRPRWPPPMPGCRAPLPRPMALRSARARTRPSLSRNMGMNIMVIGGGVAGLAIATELAERGARCVSPTVVEHRVPMPAPGGQVACWHPFVKERRPPKSWCATAAPPLTGGKRMARLCTATARWPWSWAGLPGTRPLRPPHAREPHAHRRRTGRDRAGPCRAILTRRVLSHRSASGSPPGPSALAGGLAARGIAIEAETTDQGAQLIDCRGLAARDALHDLRGVKGEMLVLRCPEISLSRPLRLLHPRIPIYLVPRGEGVFMLGATQIESDDRSRATARSILELLSAAYALHPAFGEAEILEIGVDARPAFPDNVPRIRRIGGTLYANGLFRHGFLLAPALARMVADHLLQGTTPELMQ